MPERAQGVVAVSVRHGPKLTTPPDLSVARRAAGQHGVVARSQLEDLGLCNRAIATRVRNGRLHRVHRGVYAVGCAPLTLHARFMAAVLACGDGAFLSHFCAAVLHAMGRWDGREIELTAVRSGAIRRPGLVVHRARALHPRDVMRLDRIAVTTPARTLLDLAGVLSAKQLRRMVRQTLGDRRVTLGELADVLTRANGHRGARSLADLLAADATPTRSAFEDLLLDLMLEAGLDAPDVNVALSLGGRRVVPDFRWPAKRLVVEADGAAWHDNPLARRDDADRQALLEAHGERVLRVTWQQATSRPRQTLSRIRAALQD